MSIITIIFLLMLFLSWTFRKIRPSQHSSTTSHKPVASGVVKENPSTELTQYLDGDRYTAEAMLPLSTESSEEASSILSELLAELYTIISQFSEDHLSHLDSHESEVFKGYSAQCGKATSWVKKKLSVEQLQQIIRSFRTIQEASKTDTFAQQLAAAAKGAPSPGCSQGMVD